MMLSLLLPLAQASPPPAGGLLYFVLVDRFADAVPDAADRVDHADLQAWHGGDLPGVEARLDHLAELGVTTVWLSPVFHSRQTKPRPGPARPTPIPGPLHPRAPAPHSPCPRTVATPALMLPTVSARPFRSAASHLFFAATLQPVLVPTAICRHQ